MFELQWNDIWSNILANFLTGIVSIIVGYLLIVVAVLRERRKLFRFFGIRSNNPKLSVYVGRLDVRRTKGNESLRRGYRGPAINKIEYDGAMLVCDTFNSRLIALIPGRIRDLLSKHNVAWQIMNVAVKISPKLGKEHEIVPDNLVLLGTGVYNRASTIYLAESSCWFEFTRNEQGDRALFWKRGLVRGTEIPGRAVKQELGVIQRLNIQQPRGASRTVFICAGIGSSATYGSIRYLTQNWHRLEQKYKTNEFAICLAFPGQRADSEEDSQVMSPHILHEVPTEQ